jgi:hypothetical protein
MTDPQPAVLQCTRPMPWSRQAHTKGLLSAAGGVASAQRGAWSVGRSGTKQAQRNSQNGQRCSESPKNDSRSCASIAATLGCLGGFDREEHDRQEQHCWVDGHVRSHGEHRRSERTAACAARHGSATGVDRHCQLVALLTLGSQR